MNRSLIECRQTNYIDELDMIAVSVKDLKRRLGLMMNEQKRSKLWIKKERYI
ncbi:MAG: hypothetical protein ABIJ27_02100 [Candidatus Omnitrophota bacterium]